MSKNESWDEAPSLTEEQKAKCAFFGIVVVYYEPDFIVRQVKFNMIGQPIWLDERQGFKNAVTFSSIDDAIMGAASMHQHEWAWREYEND